MTYVEKIEDAREIAAKELRFQVGTVPSLGEGEEKEDYFSFPIMYCHMELRDSGPVFFRKRKVGEIKVHHDGEVERTDIEGVKREIRKVSQKCGRGEIEKI